MEGATVDAILDVVEGYLKVVDPLKHLKEILTFINGGRAASAQSTHLVCWKGSESNVRGVTCLRAACRRSSQVGTKVAGTSLAYRTLASWAYGLRVTQCKAGQSPGVQD